MAERRKIAALAYPGLQLLDIIGPLETFNLAAQQLIDDGDRRDPAYEVLVIARDGAAEPSMSGLSVNAARSLDDPVDDIDTILIPGALSTDTSFFEDPDYIAWVKRAHRSVRRTCSVCSGALLLAAAGVLNGRRATTHWMDADELRDRFPDVRVESNQIFIEDGSVYTSGGITAGIDLALALVERDYSRRLALKVAKRLLVFLKRPGDQLQFNSFIAAQVQPTRFEALLDWMVEHLDEDISTAALASRACMSERTFRRRFEQEVGVPVRRYLSHARITRAQSLLETTSLSIAAVAARSGFKSAEAMRYAFAAEVDVTPSEYRARFGDANSGRASA